ncbi:VWA domain-containing protein [Halobaculum sp. CBA1158]|uniref:VWA domain-containing protein n=1 Tax=Halobaculum sp. CBA1158 TaxID=2904243 RepID=UPI001F2D65EB|nr:VWA domain-containing protein [Halobaculum sp. CBA1158]UIP00456.1 VWA domain-containing protein [Halobaculum sp. CBA1158]
MSRDGELPAFRAARDHVREELVRFVRSLRRAGVAVPANAGTTAARALVEVGFDDEATARAALRACLVADADDIATFDRLFPEFWRRLATGLDPDGPAPRRDGPEGGLAPIDGDAAGEDADAPATDRSDRADDGGEPDVESAAAAALGGVVTDAGLADDAERVERAWYSPTGSPTHVSGVAGAEPDIDAAVEELAGGLATLRGRRWRAGDERADGRRSLRASLATGGTVVSIPRREREHDRLRAVWFVDVSRSVLDTVDRSVLLGTLRRARAAWRECRIVFFDETARDVSSAFDEPTAAAALDALARAETEWGGGTRIGESLAGFLRESPTAVDRRTVVFVVSDGLETGDADELERAMATLSRRSAAVVWLNPLAAASAYEPTARGMARALSFVDGLFAFGGPDDLAEVGRQLRRRGVGGRIGYEYDPRRGGPRPRPDPA